MKQFILCLIISLTTILSSPVVWGDQEKAEFSIHLFQNGLPIADAEVAIHSETYETTNARQIDATPMRLIWRSGNGESAIKTNNNGSVAGIILPGNYQITIETFDQTFDFDLPLRPAENVQILVTFFANGRKPLLNIESSAAGTIAGPEAGTEDEQEKGEGIFITQILSTETNKPVKDVQVFLSGLQQRTTNRRTRPYKGRSTDWRL